MIFLLEEKEAPAMSMCNRKSRQALSKGEAAEKAAEKHFKGLGIWYSS